MLKIGPRWVSQQELLQKLVGFSKVRYNARTLISFVFVFYKTIKIQGVVRRLCDGYFCQ